VHSTGWYSCVMTSGLTSFRNYDPTASLVAARASALQSEGTPRGLAPLFWLARHAPQLGRCLAGPASQITLAASAVLRAQTRANAALVFGNEASAQRVERYQLGVVRNFFDFVLDVGDACGKTPDRLNACIDATRGEPEYTDTRARGRGVILLTAHMGSFEVGLARLVRMEPRVQVVYKHDTVGSFERMRRTLRERLGVREAPIDRGLDTWISLRDALQRGEAVVMQGDRAMPGQPSQLVPLLHGHLRVPVGAYKLARMTGSVVVPVFTVRIAPGRYQIELFPAIDCSEHRVPAGVADPAAIAFAQVLGSYIARYPEQWLVLRPAFENPPPAETSDRVTHE
jgi:lauroyl/myristoyl acyltransferase